MPAFSWGVTKHPSGDFEVTPEWAKKLTEGFEVLTKNGYYPPVLRQHKDDEGKGKEPRSLEDGFVYGKHVGIETDEQGVKYVLEVPETIKKLWEAGHIENWSPSFYEDWEHPNIDKTLDLAPRHTAFVSIPHQKDLGASSPFYSLSEADLSEGLLHLPEQPTPATEEEEMADEGKDKSTDNQEGEALAALEGRVGELTAKIDEMIAHIVEMAAPEAAEDDDEEEIEMSAEEVEALEEQLEETKKELAEIRADQTKAKIAQLGIDDEDDVEELVELREQNPGKYADRIVELAEETRKSGTHRLPEKGGNGGGSTELLPDPSLDVDQAIELAEKELKARGELEGMSKAEQNKRVVRRSRELRGELDAAS